MIANRLSDDCKSWAGLFPRLLEKFVNEENFLHSAKLFRITVYSWLFMHTALLVPYADQIWGPTSYIPKTPFDPNSIFQWIFRFIAHPGVEPYYMWMVGAQLTVLFLGIVGYRVRLMAILIYFITWNLDKHAWVVLDGGNNLTHLLMFYMIFMNTTGKAIDLKKYPIYRGLLIAASNGAIIMCMLQVLTMYVVAGILKVQGDLWQKGMSLYYLLQSITYSHPIANKLVMDHPYFAMFSTYFAVVFQLTFPMLIWFKATKHWMLLAGVALHLGISFVMGLFTFGLVMLAVYPIFFYDSWSRRVLDWLIPTESVRVAYGRQGMLSRVVPYLDWFSLVTPSEDLSIDVESQIVVSQQNGEPELLYGFDAVVRLLGRLPVFVPLIPLLMLFSYLGLGDLFFKSSQSQPITAGAVAT